MHDQELMSRNACDVAHNELDPCSNSYFLERVSELIIISNLHCQSIHYFALRNLRFRLESKSLTDALGSRSHGIMYTGKTLSAIFTTDI